MYKDKQNYTLLKQYIDIDRTHAHYLEEVDTLPENLWAIHNSWHTIFIPANAFIRPEDQTAAEQLANTTEGNGYYFRGYEFLDSVTSAMAFFGRMPMGADPDYDIYAQIHGYFGSNTKIRIAIRVKTAMDVTESKNTDILIGTATLPNQYITPEFSLGVKSEENSDFYGYIYRIGADATDTYTDSIFITGITLLYKTKNISDSSDAELGFKITKDMNLLQLDKETASVTDAASGSTLSINSDGDLVITEPDNG